MSLRAGDSVGALLIRNGKPWIIRPAGDPDFGPDCNVAVAPESEGTLTMPPHAAELGRGREGLIQRGLFDHCDPDLPIAVSDPLLLQRTLAQVLPHNGYIHPETQKHLDNGFKIAGKWTYEMWRPVSKKQGAPLRPVLIGEMPNLIVDQGKMDLFGVYFAGSPAPTPQASWYAGAISVASAGSIQAGDTAAAHGGWVEYLNYTQTTRPAWGPGAPTNVGGVAITNSAPIIMNIGATVTPPHLGIKGLFIVTDNVKVPGTAGKLWAAALFVGGDVTTNPNDELRSTYTVNI